MYLSLSLSLSLSLCLVDIFIIYHHNYLKDAWFVEYIIVALNKAVNFKMEWLLTGSTHIHAGLEASIGSFGTAVPGPKDVAKGLLWDLLLEDLHSKCMPMCYYIIYYLLYLHVFV